jgi:hypothetical protein
MPRNSQTDEAAIIRIQLQVAGEMNAKHYGLRFSIHISKNESSRITLGGPSLSAFEEEHILIHSAGLTNSLTEKSAIHCFLQASLHPNLVNFGTNWNSEILGDKHSAMYFKSQCAVKVPPTILARK